MIAAFDVLVERNEADVLVVVAPKSMVGEWAAEFRRFAGDLYRVAVADGTRQEKAAALRQGADVVVVNYEGAVALEEDLRLLARGRRVVLAVDESFNVKNPDAGGRRGRRGARVVHPLLRPVRHAGAELAARRRRPVRPRGLRLHVRRGRLAETTRPRPRSDPRRHARRAASTRAT